MIRSSRRRPNSRSSVAQTTLFETVESRVLLSASMPTGLTPAEIRQAYGFNQITFTNSNGQSIVGDGSGQTIAIVDPYNATTISSDLDKFDNTFSFDNSGQSLYQQFGAADSFLDIDSLGAGEKDSGWALEVALDVEWAHAIAPAAKIDLIEAASASTNDLLNAVDYAKNLSGVSVISMSWGGNESYNESSLDSAFTTPAGHNGVTFVASSGDDGRGASWPAVSPNVLSVGGTTLNVLSDGTYVGESTWSGSGGGFSGVEPEPSYQYSVQSTGLRSTPDVAYDANPNTGFSVYTSVRQNGQSGWFTVGGTSAGAPQWAALIAIADQGRTLAGESTLDGPTQTLPYLYEMPASSFHDITSGSNGYRATTGYDPATGLGTPIANAVVANLISPGSSNGSGAGSGAGSGTGSGSGGVTNPAPPAHQQPPFFPGRFHQHFPWRFRRWDVIASDPATSPATAVKPVVTVNAAGSAMVTAHASVGRAGLSAGASDSGPDLAGLFGATPIESQLPTDQTLPYTAAATIVPLHMAQIDSARAPSPDFIAADAPATLSVSVSNSAVEAEQSADVFVAMQSKATTLAALFSRHVAEIKDDGLESTLMVLPIAAFAVYQSRLSRSRRPGSSHWILLP